MGMMDDISIDIAGNIGAFTTGIAGGMVGGRAGAIGGGLYAAYNDTPIAAGIAMVLLEEFD